MIDFIKRKAKWCKSLFKRVDVSCMELNLVLGFSQGFHFLGIKDVHFLCSSNNWEMAMILYRGRLLLSFSNFLEYLNQLGT